jgi:putative N6-adenine-specific DNA methylase
MVTNPPYGERLNRDDVFALYNQIGTTLKHKFAGSTAWIISSNLEAFDKIGLKPDAKLHLINGSLPCDFRKYTLFSGKRKEFKSQKSKVQGKKVQGRIFVQGERRVKHGVKES